METAKGKSRDEIIARVAERIDQFEGYSGPHSGHMSELARRLAVRLRLEPADTAAVAEAALLHGIGLYAMSPRYHASPTQISFEERRDLWRHPIIGEQQMAKRDASRHAQLLVRWHHEWWNGTGYPDMLAFEDIPIGARILRAVELYCALISDRPYRRAFDPEQAREALRSSAGIECDPFVVKALVALIEEDEAQAASPEGERPDAAPGQMDPNPDSPPIELDLTPAGPSTTASVEESGAECKAAWWRGWSPSRYNPKSLLGFEASVLGQIEFKSVAIALCAWARLVWYMKTWGKVILSNDPRSWAAAASRAVIDWPDRLTHEQIMWLVDDLYVPASRLSNQSLRRWFGETDAWWMDNLRQKIDRVEEDAARAQALLLGLQAGDYARSFSQDTLELKRPLTTVFRELAGGAPDPVQSHPYSRSYNLPVEEFLGVAHADLLYLNLPPGLAEQAGSVAGDEWRESWVTSGEGKSSDEFVKLTSAPQSRQTYLTVVDRLLSSASRFKKWAIGYQDVGLASARDISDLIKRHRPVKATYSKDLTEVAGGLRNYIIVADAA